MPPGDLDRALCGLDIPSDPNVLVGLKKADDAGVYKINGELALIQTVDFFTPIVDDPFQFGQIAAANALSDVYAMGGIPKTAMNLVGFPLKQMDLSVLRQILEGGMAKLKEAQVALIGGHSVEDTELKYGLSVTGFVHPERVLTKGRLLAGDYLILTKPLGSGIINTAIKGGLADGPIIAQITELMARLNKQAASIMANYCVHACTDVTGFGLLGHLAEMVIGSGQGVQLWADDIPIIDDAVAYARMGLMPAGAYHNKQFRQSMVSYTESIDPIVIDILFDPQTSGGLLMAVAQQQAQALLADLHRNQVPEAAIIGRITPEFHEKINIVNKE